MVARSKAIEEFDRQLARLVDLGYPTLTGRSDREFTAAVRPLAETLTAEPATYDRDAQARGDHVPFVIVVSPAEVPVAAAARLMDLNGRAGVLMFGEDELSRFTPIDGLSAPIGPAYLLVDIDTGTDFLNVAPADALPVISARGRTPLTIAEGVAVVTQRPDMLRRNKCFSLLGSRSTDKRVPAVWISDRRPKLGWCWAGNPHTWLGSASCGKRLGQRR